MRLTSEEFGRAASNGDEASIRAALTVDASLAREPTALGDAAFGGHVGVLRVLLEFGADPNFRIPDANGMTLVMSAAGQGHREAVACLLGAGASIHAVDEDGDAALSHACGSRRPDVVRLLVERGADLRRKNRYGATPMHSLVNSYSRAEAGVDDVAVASILLQSGAEVDAADDRGATPLSCAAYSGRVELARFLVRHGARVNGVHVENHYGNTPLHEAAQRGHADVVRVLLEAGAEVDAPLQIPQAIGYTPLHWAACRGHAEIVRLLLDAGADKSRRATGSEPSMRGTPRDVARDATVRALL